MKRTVFALVIVFSFNTNHSSSQTVNFVRGIVASPPATHPINFLPFAQFDPPSACISPIRPIASNQIIDCSLPVQYLGHYIRREEKFSPKNRIEVLARRGKIKTEIDTLKDHSWAGHYSIGDGFMSRVQIVLAPKSGFIYTAESLDQIGLNGGLIDQNYGDVNWENGRIKLSPVLENSTEVSLPIEFIPITWDEQLYLVPANGIIDFCNAVNSGLVFSFVRNGDLGTKPPTRMPDVPEEFKPYLLEEPIDGQIIATEETKTIRKHSSLVWETVVTINKGIRDNVLPDMKFHVTNPKAISGEIKVTMVMETESKGIMSQGEAPETSQIGWSVSTRHAFLHQKP